MKENVAMRQKFLDMPLTTHSAIIYDIHDNTLEYVLCIILNTACTRTIRDLLNTE